MKSPKILFYAHFFFPEVGAGSLRAQYFVKTLKEAGFNVKVIAPIPNYPHGKHYAGYEKKYFVDHDKNVTYLPIYIPSKHSITARGLLYSSYLATSFFYTITDRFKPDLIISSSPPILTSFSAFVASKIRRSCFILDLRDIWPDIGIELGLIKNRFIVSILKKIEKTLLKNSLKITVTAHGDKFNLIEKGVSRDKIQVIYNGADTELFYPKNEQEIKELKREFNLPLNKKLLVYFGSFNYGMNDVGTMKSALISISNEKNNIHFVAAGGGDLKKEFLNDISKNISYSSFQNLSNKQLADLVSVCDVSLIPRKGIEKDTGGNIPVKCFESWAAGVPVLLSTMKDSEIAKIFEECGGGKMIGPNNHEGFRDSLLSLINDPLLKQLGNRGREYVLDRYDRKLLSQKIVQVIEEVLSKKNVKNR